MQQPTKNMWIKQRMERIGSMSGRDCEGNAIPSFWERYKLNEVNNKFIRCE
jgi:hypothetical protein